MKEDVINRTLLVTKVSVIASRKKGFLSSANKQFFARIEKSILALSTSSAASLLLLRNAAFNIRFQYLKKQRPDN